MVEFEKSEKDEVSDCSIHVIRIKNELFICANIFIMSVTNIGCDDVDVD